MQFPSSSVPILDDIYSVIRSKSLEYKFDNANENLILKICPICQDSGDHFYVGIAPKNLGLWNCFKCRQGGGWNKLKRHLVGEEGCVIETAFKTKTKIDVEEGVSKTIAAHQKLLSDPEAMEWLVNRNIKIDAIQKYKLGVKHIQHPKTKEHIKYLTIPFIFKEQLVDIKYRSLPPARKSFYRTPGGMSILYNYDNIDHSLNYIYICEGELDAISLAQEGETNIVSITVGAKSFIPEWFDLLKEFDIIYLVMDNDAAGQDGAKIIAKRLGRDRCYNILLPKEIDPKTQKPKIKDLNDYFRYHDLDDFKTLTLRATQFTIDTIYSLENVISRLEMQFKDKGELIEGLMTPWESLNSKMGPIARGDLVYLSGRPKSGKTTVALNLCYDFAYFKKIPSLLFCLEMPPERLSAKLICRHRLTAHKDVSLDDIYLTRADFLDPNNGDTQLYFGYTADPNYLNVDAMFKVFELAVRKYGIEFLVFDNLQFLSRSVTHTAQEIAMISRQFKVMAMNFNIRIMVIVQPKRISEDEIMTSVHMKDSSAMEADADCVLICHRRSFAKDIYTKDKVDDEALLSPIVTLTVDRTRYAQGGFTRMFLEGAKSYIREATDKELLLDGGR